MSFDWPFVPNAMATQWHDLPYESRMQVIQRLTLKMFQALN